MRLLRLPIAALGVLSFLVAFGCAASMSKERMRVTCYSGGTKIYEATLKRDTRYQSLWHTDDGQAVYLSADCVGFVTAEPKAPASERCKKKCKGAPDYRRERCLERCTR